MSNITLTSSIRSNLQSLRNIGAQLDKTQQRLSSGLKVNSAIDNASSYYQARSLTNRAADLNNLLDSMGQGIKAIEAATSGLEAGASILEQASVVASDAYSNASYKVLESCVALTDNAAELIAQGYTAVSTVEELEKALNKVVTTNPTTGAETITYTQSDAKIVLTSDITLSSTMTLTGSNVTINGGGHKLTLSSSNYIQFTGSDVSVSNMSVEVKNTWGYTCLSFTGKNASVKDVSFNTTVEMKNAYWRAISLSNSGAEVENVDVKAQGSGTELIGVYCSSQANIKNFTMTANMVGNGTIVGIAARNGSNITLDNMGIIATGEGLHYGAVTMGDGKISNITSSGKAERADNEALYDGEGNTQAMIDSLGAKALAASAANQFYAPGVDANDSELGQGTWYLPSIGELMDMYGTDISKMTDGYGSSGNNSETRKKFTAINNTLDALGGEASTFSSGYYWSSSEYSPNYSWILSTGSGFRTTYSKDSATYVRCFQLLENCFNPLTLSDGSSAVGGAQAPEIGNVMYKDTKTGELLWGSADEYKTLKTKATENGETNRYVAVGVVCDVNYDDGSVKIVNLKDLRFNATDGVLNSDKSFTSNFDPDNPYNNAAGTSGTTKHTTSKDTSYVKDIEEIENYQSIKLYTSFGGGELYTVDDVNNAFPQVVADEWQQKFEGILSEYDNLINDSSYQGVNLLTGGKVDVTFNETRTNKFSVQGADMSSDGLGLREGQWKIPADIADAIKNIASAVNSMRAFQEELGNNYGIIQTRQTFTDALTDVLETGADMLVLADMNEESAEYLMLQTRQQLAINSLSLAAQSAQSVMSLF